MLRFVTHLPRLAVLTALVLLVPQTQARADDATGAVPDADMKGLAAHAQAFEEMMKRGAFTFSFHVEQYDDKGKTSDVTDVSIRSTPVTLEDRTTKILQYTVDGKDKTVEMQKKADERRTKKKEEKKSKNDKSITLDLPFSPSEQGKYIFSIAERDASNPAHVRVNFNPKEASEERVKGSAWYDESTKQILSVGFSLSKNPTFVDHVNVQVLFGLPTTLGLAPSKIDFDIRGSFLFIHRKYRGTASFREPVLTL